MRVNAVREALKAGHFQLGTNFGVFRSAEIPRLLAAAGFHWTFIDTEHGGFGIETIQDVCRSANLAGIAPIVRVADLQYDLVARALDCGAQGIIFPRIEDPRLLETAISWTRFPPDGVRGYGLQPSQVEYQAVPFNEVIAHVNANTLTVMQIESARGVEARADILSVPGIDAVLIGPADLSISLGVPGQFDHPKLLAAIESIRETCDQMGVVTGIHTRTVPLARHWKERGFRFVGCGSDVAFLWEKASETVRAIL